MDVREAIRERRSVRGFLDKSIPEGSIAALKDAIIRAPSAGNLQARRFYFVFERGIRLGIATVSLSQMFIAAAPLVVVACADLDRISRYGRRGTELYVIQDVAVAVENLMLQACEEGLGSVWVGAFEESGISDLLALSPRIIPMAVVPVGYPAFMPPATARDPEEELIKVIR